MRRFVFVVCPILIAGSVAFGQARFEGMGVFPGEKASDVMGVSADGSIAVGWSGSLNTGGPYVWKDGIGMTPLDVGPILFPSALGLSADGTTVVGIAFHQIRGDFAFRWDAVNGSINLGALPSETLSVAFGTSGDGSVVVGRSGMRAFRWDEVQGMLGLGALGNAPEGGEAMSVSDDGTTIVGWAFSSNVAGGEAFRWTPTNRMEGLGDLPGGTDESIAFDVSADGGVIVGTSRSDNGLIESFRHTDGYGMVGLGAYPRQWPGHFRSLAVGVSGDGNRIVGRVSDQTDEQAYIWEPHRGMRGLKGVLEDEYGLDLTGWELVHAEKISSDGTTIVGWGYSPNLQQEAWRAVLPPYCAADCDRSTGGSTLDVFDFLCFQSSFVAGEEYACDCDTSTGRAVCDVFDFLCFQNAFVTGCP